MSRLFAAWGRFVHRRPLAVLAGSAFILALSIVGLLHAGTLVTSDEVKSNLEYQHAATLANTATGQGNGKSSFLLIFESSSLSVSDPAYQAALESAVAPLQSDSRVTGVATPYTVPDQARAAFISRDGHQAMVEVSLRDSASAAGTYWQSLRAEVHPGPLTVRATGLVPITDAFNKTLEHDLQRAEFVSLPISLLLLLVVFGSIVSAFLPLGVGVLAIIGGLGGTLALARVSDVSQYALNVVTLIGLGVAIDYSLFVVNRFREELAGGASREDALATTLATAGRAITFSGLTVAIGLSALLFYQGTFMASMGLAGAIVVGVAVLYGLTVLPAVLALLGPRVDMLRLPLPRRRGPDDGMWGRIASFVMRRPVVVLVPVLGLLLVAGTPFLGIRLANGNVDMLPAGVEARDAYDALRTDFPGYNQNTYTVVVHVTDRTSVTQHSADVAALSGRLAKLGGVLQVSPAASSSNVAVLDVTSNQGPTSDGARTLLRQIRAERVPGAEVLVGGQTAFDVDTIDFILSRTPLAVGFVVAITLVVLFLLTGSALLPFKAVLTNLVSISASFGALVWIFQQGHLSAQLGFTPQSIDPSIPVILFAIVFGMSMDYEVLLVSRIQEEYHRLGDNTKAVASGLARTGRLITGAAAIMVVVFLAFGMAQVVIIKAIGIGLAVAVTLDATLVRALVVPSVMRLLGDVNWWAPAPLRRLHRWAGIAESDEAPTRAA